MADHTQGPREASEPGDYGDYNGNCIVILGDDRRLIIVLGSDDESKANARLATHAPEMLALLQRAFTSAKLPPKLSNDISAILRAALTGSREGENRDG